MNSSTKPSGNQVDREEVRRAAFLSAFLEPGDVVEVRLPGSSKGTISGYFVDPDKFSRAVVEVSSRFHASCYFTLNQLRPDLLARSHNRLTHYSRHTTKDDEILRRRWLLIDIDPKRPS